MGYSSSVNCSACGASKCPLTPHPMLDVPVCTNCSRAYHSGEFTLSGEVGGNEIYCRWCGNGGELYFCDSCPKSFCSGCIQRNFGLTEMTRIAGLSERWSCFVCSPLSLDDLIDTNGWDIGNSVGSSATSGIQKKRKVSSIPNIICSDVSRGRERFPIQVFNDVDRYFIFT